MRIFYTRADELNQYNFFLLGLNASRGAVRKRIGYHLRVKYDSCENFINLNSIFGKTVIQFM